MTCGQPCRRRTGGPLRLRPAGRFGSGVLHTVIEAFKKFQSVRNSLPFALIVNRRPIVMEADIYAFLGASGGDGTGEVQVYSGGPFRGPNQVAVRAHINRIGRKSALEGF